MFLKSLSNAIRCTVLSSKLVPDVAAGSGPRRRPRLSGSRFRSLFLRHWKWRTNPNVSHPSATRCSAAISVEDGDKAGQLFFTAAGEKLLKAKLQVGNSIRESPSAFVQ